MEMMICAYGGFCMEIFFPLFLVIIIFIPDTKLHP